MGNGREYLIKQALLGFKRCLPKRPPSWEGPIALYEESHEHPRYFLSPSYLAHDNGYWWGWLNGCLVILKKRWLRSPVLYAVLPPLPQDGSSTRQLDTIRQLLDMGIGVRLSEDDLNNWDGGLEGVTVAQGWAEFCYRLSDMVDLQGRERRAAKSAINQATRLRKSSLLTWNTTTADAPDINVAVLASSWEHGHTWKGQRRHAETAMQGDATITTVHSTSEGLLGYSLSEVVAPRWVIGAARCSKGSPESYRQINRLLQYLDGQHHLAAFGADGWYNFGTAVGLHGLLEHKKALGKYALLQLFHARPKQPVTPEEWRAALTQ